jgi:hypothetical protein
MCLVLTAEAAFLDDDLDGVANEDDLCPNSALTDIVDATGCPVSKITFKKEHHFDITAGISYSKFDDNNSQTAQSISLGYYYGNFSAYVYTSNYDLDTGESGIDDSTLALYYRKVQKNIAYKVGIGSYIPTNNTEGNNADYFFNTKLTYYMDPYDFTVDFQHTVTNDDGMEDTNRFTVTVGYLLSQNGYTTLSYTRQNSVYADEVDLENTAIYISYFLNTHWFISGEISLGISESATDFSSVVNLGYYF